MTKPTRAAWARAVLVEKEKYDLDLHLPRLQVSWPHFKSVFKKERSEMHWFWQCRLIGLGITLALAGCLTGQEVFRTALDDDDVPAVGTNDIVGLWEGLECGLAQCGCIVLDFKSDGTGIMQRDVFLGRMTTNFNDAASFVWRLEGRELVIEPDPMKLLYGGILRGVPASYRDSYCQFGCELEWLGKQKEYVIYRQDVLTTYREGAYRSLKEYDPKKGLLTNEGYWRQRGITNTLDDYGSVPNF